MEPNLIVKFRMTVWPPYPKDTFFNSTEASRISESEARLPGSSFAIRLSAVAANDRFSITVKNSFPEAKHCADRAIA